MVCFLQIIINIKVVLCKYIEIKLYFWVTDHGAAISICSHCLTVQLITVTATSLHFVVDKKDIHGQWKPAAVLAIQIVIAIVLPDSSSIITILLSPIGTMALSIVKSITWNLGPLYGFFKNSGIHFSISVCMGILTTLPSLVIRNHRVTT